MLHKKTGLALLVLTAAMFFGAGIVHATQFPTLYGGARALGMGGAYTAIADDADALMYNPAGLSRADGMEMDLFNLQGEVSDEARDIVDDLEAAQGTGQTNAANVIRAHVGEHVRARATTFPTVIIPGFGFGVIGQATLDADLRNPVSPVVEVDTKVDRGVMAALAMPFGKDGQHSVGISGKMMSRKGLTRTYTALDIASDKFDPVSDVGNEQEDTAFDIGVILRPQMTMSPRFAVVAQNLSDLDFGPLGKVPMQVNVGAAFQPELGPFTLTVSADIVDVTRNIDTDKDWEKRTNLGAEVQVWKFLAARAGLHQGYLTAGATLNLWAVKLDLATYGEELGAYGGQREDRRYVVKLNFF
ncbi:MAG: hypothetical protein ACE5FN_01985 [Leptospirillia bacterium]